jgi:hypothetical protein
MAFAVTLKAMEVLLKTKSVFSCHKDKIETILKGEYGLTLALLDANMNFDSLLLKYNGVNWLDQKNWNCNKNIDPLRETNYLINSAGDARMRVHPLETVFFKAVWSFDGNFLSESLLKETLAYLDWAVERKRISKKEG